LTSIFSGWWEKKQCSDIDLNSIASQSKTEECCFLPLIVENPGNIQNKNDFFFIVGLIEQVFKTQNQKVLAQVFGQT
jgi:hypothetical protein